MDDLILPPKEMGATDTKLSHGYQFKSDTEPYDDTLTFNFNNKTAEITSAGGWDGCSSLDVKIVDK